MKREKICFLSIDVEKDFGKDGFLGVKKLEEILEFLKKEKVNGTLFVTGEVLEKFSDFFKKWKDVFEISSHSFSHRFWNELSQKERERELEKFLSLYKKVFHQSPLGFRAPSHIIDDKGLELLEKKGFLYDSSFLPHYPPFKKYRGYQGRKPLFPYYPKGRKILEIPLRGQILGIPLAGKWIRKLPIFLYKILFFLHSPSFITLSFHSWDALDRKFFKKLKEILKILKSKKYKFLNAKEIFHQNRK